MTNNSSSFSTSSSSSQECDQNNDFSLQTKALNSEPLNVTIKPAIRNGNVMKKYLENNEKNSWRKYGIKKRKKLLKDDEKSGGSSFIIHEHTNIKRYFEIANRVLEQFRSAYEEDKNPEETYLMGHRLVKFLCEVLPTHNQYNNPDIVRLRISSQNYLAQVRIDLENVALKIDRFYYNENLHLVKEDKTLAPTELEVPELAMDESSSSKIAEKRVTFDLKPSRLDQTNNFSLGDRYMNYDGSSFSRFPDNSQDPLFNEDVPDMSFSSGSSSGSQSTSSFDSDKNNSLKEKKADSSKGCEVTFEDLETEESLFNLETSIQDIDGGWEPFGSWKIQDGLKKSDDTEKSKMEFLDGNSIGDCEQNKSKCNPDEADKFCERNFNQSQNSLDEKNLDSNNSSCNELFDSAEEYESVDDTSAEYLNDNVEEDGVDTNAQNNVDKIYPRDQNSLNALYDSYESEDTHYEDAFSEYDEEQELSFVEKIALENTSNSIDRLHETDGDDSDAEDSWAQEEDIVDEYSDYDSGYQRSQSTFDIMMSIQGEANIDSDESDNSSFDSQSLTDDDECEHNDFMKEVSDEFAEFDLCSGGEKTTSTAETEALTIEEYSDDESSATYDNPQERNGILGIARREGYVPTIEDVNSCYNFNSDSGDGPKKLDYLESRLRTLENNRKQNITSEFPNHLKSKTKTNSTKFRMSSTAGPVVNNTGKSSRMNVSSSQRKQYENFSIESVADLPSLSLSRASKLVDSQSIKISKSIEINKHTNGASRSSHANKSNQAESPFSANNKIKPTIDTKHISPGRKGSKNTDVYQFSNHRVSKQRFTPFALKMVRKHSIDINKSNLSAPNSSISHTSPGKKGSKNTDENQSSNHEVFKQRFSPSTLNMVRKHSIDINKSNLSAPNSSISHTNPGRKGPKNTDENQSPNHEVSKQRFSPSTLNMVRKHSIDMNKSNQSAPNSPISSRAASCASPRLSSRLERIKKTAAWKRKYEKNTRSD